MLWNNVFTTILKHVLKFATKSSDVSHKREVLRMLSDKTKLVVSIFPRTEWLYSQWRDAFCWSQARQEVYWHVALRYWRSHICLQEKQFTMLKNSNILIAPKNFDLSLICQIQFSCSLFVKNAYPGSFNLTLT